jgi:hypothetical protein
VKINKTAKRRIDALDGSKDGYLGYAGFYAYLKRFSKDNHLSTAEIKNACTDSGIDLKRFYKGRSITVHALSEKLERAYNGYKCYVSYILDEPKKDILAALLRPMRK